MAKLTTRKTKKMLLEELEAANENVRDLKKELVRLERFKQYVTAADESKAAYDAFVQSGFTEEQAFDLLKIMFKNAIPR